MPDGKVNLSVTADAGRANSKIGDQMRTFEYAGRRTKVIAAVSAIAAILTGGAAPASGAPRGLFSALWECPTSTPGVVLCVSSQTTGGELVIGTIRVPITKPIALQGGAIETGRLNQYYLALPTSGTGLSNAAMNVPGGVSGLIRCSEARSSESFEEGICKAVRENGENEVTATIELETTASNRVVIELASLIFEEGPGITLPMRIHLKNPMMGAGCYLGSTAHPIELHLTTGATSPPAPFKQLKGKAGKTLVSEEGGFELSSLTGTSLVDNTFTTPVAEGCGGVLASVVDPLVDSKAGLPSTAGHGTAIMNGNITEATASAVLASEKF